MVKNTACYPDPAFWKGKRVFLTGHTGFKGGWLSLWLQSLGAEVTGYALQSPTTPSLFNIARVGDGTKSIIGDIRDLAEMTRSMQAAEPEIVIHMAAQSLVRYSYKNPVETYSTNVMGTVNLLEAARSTPSVKAVLVVTSDKCYENHEWVWGYRENDPMGGHDPYSNSKGCAELVCAAYRSSYFNPKDQASHRVLLATARAGNVIGGGDWAQDRLVPDILAAFEQGKSVQIRNPRAIRPWQYVLEPLRGYLVLVENLLRNGSEFADCWNFGSDDVDAKPVVWIVNRLAKIWGKGAAFEIVGGKQPHEANYLKLDCSKAKSCLAWYPSLTLEAALQWTISWHQAYLQGIDMRAFSLWQIQTYSAGKQEHGT
ncbi:MAG: CDP-glucose 4,6-dehydratase [Anaerolineales bacterium]|nr:MAG: CDP-glucose 4,6-dehydratase [Anaerolineales bacterium]